MSDRNGFPCPHCGAAAFTTDSRQTKQGRRRRRECTGCCNRFSTMEMSFEMTNELMILRQDVKILRRMLGTDKSPPPLTRRERLLRKATMKHTAAIDAAIERPPA